MPREIELLALGCFLLLAVIQWWGLVRVRKFGLSLFLMTALICVTGSALSAAWIVGAVELATNAARGIATGGSTAPFLVAAAAAFVSALMATVVAVRYRSGATAG